MKYIGIDVSQSTLDIAYVDDASIEQVAQIANELSSIKSFFTRFLVPFQVVLEATGVYHLNLVYFLKEQNIPVTILNPLSLKGFATSYLISFKTDAADASLLLRFATERCPTPSVIPTSAWQQKRQLLSEWEYILKQLRREENRLHALTSWNQSDSNSIVLIEERIALLQQQQAVLEEQLQSMTQPTTEEDFEKQVEFATSIQGIGKKTALFLLTFTHGLDYFNSPKELAKFLGLVPTIHQSGKYKKRGHITKKGNAYLRGLLFCCARSARRFNPQCKALYERLRQKGKPYKVAMIAVAHKLIRQLFAVVKNEQPYQAQI